MIGDIKGETQDKENTNRGWAKGDINKDKILAFSEFHASKKQAGQAKIDQACKVAECLMCPVVTGS